MMEDLIKGNHIVCMYNSKCFGIEVFYENKYDSDVELWPSFSNWIIPGTFTPEMADALNVCDRTGRMP